MQRAYSLKKNRQFQYVYRRGKSCACRELVLLYVRAPRLQVGFSASKKVGNSVVRNRLKRLLRENIRPLLPRLKPGLYIFVLREAATGGTFHTLGASALYLLRKQQLLTPGREV